VKDSAYERRLSLDRCRELLGPSCDLTDQQLEEVRDGLYSAANDLLDLAQEQMNSHRPADRP